jgi:negative regulator of sigma-B (phosphoserine phosphatase)
MSQYERTSSPIQWGVAARTMVGCDESGDGYLVESFPGGVTVVVVDGLGHGPRAAAVAQTAVAVLTGHAYEPVGLLLQRCHKGLLGTRGVVMSLASFNALNSTMTWAGVGNVTGVLLRANPVAGRGRESLLPRGGVVGYQLPSPRPVVISVSRGDTLIFATDGIRSSFILDLNPDDSPQQIAEQILASHSRGTDDALVLAARYVGQESP